MGHAVTVFTTSRDTIGGSDNWDRIDDNLEYSIIRTDKFIQWKKTLVTYDPGIRREIRSWNPELGFVIGAGYGPPYYWMNALPEACRVISQFSDLPWHHRSGGLVWRWKQRWYRNVFARSSLVLAVTKDTARLIRGVGGRALEPKLRMTGLSFDSQDFKPGSARLCPIPAIALANRCPFLMALVTRITPDKKLPELFHGVETFLKRHSDAGLVVAGFREDAFGKQFRSQIAQSEVADRCCLLPVLSVKEINGLFSVAQCSLWSRESIGLQHSLASGCPIILQKGLPAEHILHEGVSGVTYESFAELELVLQRVREQAWDRERVYDVVKPYRSDIMLERLLGEVFS